MLNSPSLVFPTFVKRYFSTFSLFATLLIAPLVMSCGGGQETSRPESITDNATRRFNEGKEAYNNQKWQDAIRIFDEIRIQAPTSSVAAEAAYLQGMARYKMESYSAAAVDFRSVRRSYSGSEFAPRAQFMVAESYYQMSPRAELDQTYSVHALNEYQLFLREFPKAQTALIDSAQMRMRELRNRMAHKVLLAAELYLKTEEYKAANIYFERVLDQFYDSPYAPEAQLRIAEVAQGRKKLDDARDALKKFEDKYLQAASEEQRQRARNLKASL